MGQGLSEINSTAPTPIVSSVADVAQYFAGLCRIILEHNDSWRDVAQPVGPLEQIALNPNADSGVFKRVLY
jgi:hypothetical protein